MVSALTVRDLAEFVFTYSDAPECTFVEIEPMCWELRVAAEHLQAAHAAIEPRRTFGLRIIPVAA
jgi:hypothetical protein